MKEDFGARAIGFKGSVDNVENTWRVPSRTRAIPLKRVSALTDDSPNLANERFPVQRIESVEQVNVTRFTAAGH